MLKPYNICNMRLHIMVFMAAILCCMICGCGLCFRAYYPPRVTSHQWILSHLYLYCIIIVIDSIDKQSGILRVSDLYQLEVVLFMYDYVRTKLPLSFRNIFKFNCDVYDAYITRRAQMFHIPKTKSRFVDKLPLYNFPSMWNNWCTQLNVNSSRGALKNSMKTILMNYYATLVKCENPRCIDCQLIT